MNKVNLNTISLNSSSLNAIGEVKMGGASGGGGLDAIGVFIYDIDGKLTAPEDWNPANNDKAVGVYVGTDIHRFVIAKEDALKSNLRWGGYDKLIEGLPEYINRDEAILDFDGETNTYKIISELSGYNDGNSTGAPACEACVNYVFPNGKRGYLGSAGEWQMCLSNKQAIIDAIEKCGGIQFNVDNWVSTQKNATDAWNCVWGNTTLYYFPKKNSSRARAFLKI